MMAGTVFNQLILILQNNPALSDYVEHVFKSIRYNIEPDSLPCIMVEIRGNNEIERDMGQFKKIWLDVDIVAHIATPDPEYAIVGDATKGAKGILDIENDIRACLQSSYSLAGYSDDIRFEPTVFREFELKNIMTRALFMPIRILYTQTDGI